MNKLKIKAFGIVAETLGATDMETDPFTDLQSFKAWLESGYPKLKETPYAIAVNRKLAHENIILPESCELALLPPFSGG
ncbi:MAG: MoaD/ThiS family protein [Saprospiraceae bacterium]|nr:MoaD/ThiS family protein [Saprospiraceae bacterium]